MSRSLCHSIRAPGYIGFDLSKPKPYSLIIRWIKPEHLIENSSSFFKLIHTPEAKARANESLKEWRGSDRCKDLCRENLRKARLPGGGQHKWATSDAHKVLKSKQLSAQWKEKDSKIVAWVKSDEFKKPKEIPTSSLPNPSDQEATYIGHKGQGYQVQERT